MEPVNYYKLHEAIALVLTSSPGYTASFDWIADEINRNELYFGKDGSQVSADQIRLRTTQSRGHYKDLFKFIEPDLVKLIHPWKVDLRRRIPLPHMTKFGLLGFYAEQATITLDKDHVIKKVSRSEREKFYGRITGVHADYEKSEYPQYEYMLEYSYMDKGYQGTYPHEQVWKKLHFISFLRIYKDGSVDMPHFNNYGKLQGKKSYTSMGFVELLGKTFTENEKYSISKGEVSDFKKFWKKFSSINRETNGAFFVAISRLKDSYDRTSWEDQVIDLMIAYEALFLVEKSELSYRLSQRVAYHLRDHFETKMIQEFMKRGYGIRSKIVHGDIIQMSDLNGKGLEPSKKYALQANFMQFLRDLLRISLKEYVGSYHQSPVRDFIKHLDQGIIKQLGFVGYSANQ